ncbi:ribonuclease T2 [Rhizobium sp. RU20A]|uniref:ribonuclease T2 family protein n=1 Tax=Rhizobium sp. RU20A TaxID=1907412 RepID=UPI00095471DD|nr:ribonuclease T2 [Rhizobium sp. RU20A]SIP94368.1 ribonuclease T2 [Rhizobium sp. RU20A]
MPDRTKTASFWERQRGRMLTGLGALAILAGGGDGAEGETRASATKPAATTEQTASTTRLPQGSGFDFYVLSLSWSPTWCAGNDPNGRTDQCEVGAENAFVVHGLWPQYERGYPEFCKTDEPDRVSNAIGREVIDIMPSMGLIGHQWRKHGSCSGLSQRDYFTVVAAAREKIAIPVELQRPTRALRRAPLAVEDAFIASNPGLDRRMMAATCRSGELQEVRICLSKSNLSFRACPEVDRDSCRARDLAIPPVP